MVTVSKCPRLIEDYKNYLRTTGDYRSPFSDFCLRRGMCMSTIDHWMMRNGTSVSLLRYEVMLEMYAANPTSIAPPEKPSDKKKNVLDLCQVNGRDHQVLKGVSINFPDGTVVNIRQASAVSLNKFIELYHQTCEKAYVRS